MTYHDDEDCHTCGRCECECDDVDDFTDQCMFCGRMSCVGECDENTESYTYGRPSPWWARYQAAERRKRDAYAARLSACSPRLRRALLASRKRRDDAAEAADFNAPF